MRIERHPILTFDRGRRAAFLFNGRRIEGHTNETVAAALVAAGVPVLGESVVLRRPRGFFCGIGRCSSCSMTINGVPNVRSCVTLVEKGMDVRTQEGAARIDVKP